MSDPTPEPTPQTPTPDPTPPTPDPAPPTPPPTPTPQPPQNRNDNNQSLMDAINSLPEKIAHSVTSVLEAKPTPPSGSTAPAQQDSGAPGNPGSGGAGQRRSFVQWWFGSK